MDLGSLLLIFWSLTRRLRALESSPRGVELTVPKPLEWGATLLIPIGGLERVLQCPELIWKRYASLRKQRSRKRNGVDYVES